MRFRIQPNLLLDYTASLLLLNNLRSWQSKLNDPSEPCEKVYLHSWSCVPNNTTLLTRCYS